MVGDADGDAKIVLGVAGIVGKAGAHVIDFHCAQTEASGEPNVHASADLHRKCRGTGCDSRCGWKDTVEPMRKAEERLTENIRSRL